MYVPSGVTLYTPDSVLPDCLTSSQSRGSYVQHPGKAITRNIFKKIYNEDTLCYIFLENLAPDVLSVNEKLPVSKFRYFEKYIIQLFGYCYVHVSGQRHSDLER